MQASWTEGDRGAGPPVARGALERRVVAIGRCDYSSERDTVSVYDRGAFDALLSPALSPPQGAFVMQQSTATSESSKPTMRS